MSTDPEIINVAPPTELLASASLPSTLFSSLVTPNNQRTASSTFTFTPDDSGNFGDQIKNLIDNKMNANKEEHGREKRVLNYTIGSLRDDIDEKDKELEIKDGEIRNLNRRNEKDKDDHRKSENETYEMIEKLEHTVDGLEKGLVAAEAETQDTKQELNDANKKYTKLDQESKKKLNTMKTSHEGNIQEQMVRNEKLKQDVVKEKAISQQNCDILVLQVSGLEMKVGFAEHDLSKANTERDNAIKDHRKDNMELSGQISVVQSRVVTLEGDLATMGAEKEGLAKEKEQLRVELEAKEEEYNATVASTTTSNDKAHALKEETIKNERAEKEALAKEKEQLEVELEVKEEEYNTTLTFNKKELASKDETIKNVCAEKEELASKNAQLQDELKSMEESHNTALALKDKELASKDVELTTKDKELVQLHAEVEQLRTDKLEAEFTKRKEELARRIEEIARKREELDGEQEELNRRKERFLMDGDNDNKEDVMKTAPTPSAANISSDDDNEVEVEIVGSTGDNANSDYPHARCDCTVHHFDNTNDGSIRHPSSSLAKKNEQCCQNCYCFVCDTLAPECKEWCGTAGHCNATSTSKKWREFRIKKREAKTAM